MNEIQLRNTLASVSVGSLRYFNSIGSTNDEALAWALQGAPDFSLVIANEQTKGRGRMNRKWFTPAGSALAMSLILRPSDSERAFPARTTGLLALSLVDCLHELGLTAEIKWPNDVLVKGRKLAGILVESTWMGEELDALVLGMGVNVLKASAPPADQVLFPATSIERELGRPLKRAKLLRDILNKVQEWRPNLGAKAFLEAWDANLAFRGQQVQVEVGSGNSVSGELLGLSPDGSLRLRDSRSKSVTVQFGEVHLRPLA